MRLNQARRRSKLTENDVKEIRKRYAKGGITQKELGEIYGVSTFPISTVVNRKGWKHVGEDDNDEQQTSTETPPTTIGGIKDFLANNAKVKSVTVEIDGVETKLTESSF
ncbi:helix-turn-helix domain-containing protein [Halobacillus halophilus]|uniref:hypothetical protein n=1 Tax=Halobacillus halophilus TaxID=1570 RepID=UPI0002FF53E8|nr:hypothetical protein [Halobacillus halophilus]